jgi:pimeloyl-ACP methyl ester carboxylesterase
MARRGVCIVERKRRRLSWSLVALAGIAASLVGCRQPPPPPSGTNIPIVFVHGIVGSGDQYRAMAQYWASNGFPAERVRAYDYNSVGGTAAIGPFIDQVMREFNVSKVHLVGHSLGTIYVAAFAPTSNKVDRWFLVDGAGCGAGQSRCAAVHQADLRAVGGGNQTHVETSVSPESFARQYQHFMGRAPATTKVVPETGSTIRVAGRVQEFMVNSAVSNAQVRIWETDPATGHRASDSPAGTASSRSDGQFGPVSVPQGKAYEVELTRPGSGVLHAYYQPFMRSDLLLRLNTVSTTSANYTNTNRGPNHAAMSVVRNREFWRSHGAGNDVLSIQTTTPDGRSQPEVNAFENVRGDVVGVHVHDNAATPGQSSLALLPYFSTQAFQTGVDVFMPASDPPNGTITLTVTPRGDATKKQVIKAANWASDGHGMTVNFNDYVS